MKTNTLVIPCLATGLLLTLTSAATAQNVSVGGPVVPGQGRPPLFLHLRPMRGSKPPPPPSTPVGYSPALIRTAYGFNNLTQDGAGQTIAIVDAYGDGNLSSDVSAFNQQWGLPQFGGSGPTLAVVSQAGTRATSSGWALETALDVEWAHAIAPKANILLVLAKTASLGNLLSAVQYASQHASVVSMSWGSSEFSTETAYDSYFDVSGVTFVASSGDSGELSSGVEWPAASPYVLSVGGTSLYLDNSGNWASETAWSGSGGGISLYQGIPAYQVGWQLFDSGGMRTVPDVSYVADPNTGVAVYCAAYGGWVEVGGTSAGAPQWAALVALANQAQGGPLGGAANAALYSAAVSTTTAPINPSYFIDITSGNNGSTSDTDDNAVVGYDFVTGLGSPVANNLVPNL